MSYRVKVYGQAKHYEGIVVSDKMHKTRAVVVERLKKDSLYGKYVRVKAKFKAHDSNNSSHMGDKVEIISSRPISRDKRWRVARVINVAPRNE